MFADTNLYTLRMLSTVSEVLSYLQAFEEASYYALCYLLTDDENASLWHVTHISHRYPPHPYTVEK